MSYSPPGLAVIYGCFLVISICCSTAAHNGQHQDQSEATYESRRYNFIEIHISKPENGGHFEIGSSIRLQCKFKRNNSIQPNLRFNLRWLRSVVGSDHDQNQTITETDIDSSNTIIAATTRIWSVRRDDGLYLELNYLQASDSGIYYCQAISVEQNPIILSESSIQLSAVSDMKTSKDGNNYHTNSSSDLTRGSGDEDDASDSYQLYSQENLSKLLPSLKIVPGSFNQVPLGESLQLACITNDLDPDPEPDKLEWTFEQIGDRLDLLERPPMSARNTLPYNVTVSGNVLVIRSMLEEHSGLYKCTYRMGEFNLTAQASSEVHAIRGEQIYSAPLVVVKPELVRLSINGSASILCEATGFPPPELIWYRVNDFAKSELIVNNTGILARYSDQEQILQSHIQGLVVEQTEYKNLAAHCHLNRCSTPGQESTSYPHRNKLTALSVIHLHEARESHQGQYVCQASNKHGSNQATCIVDVEIKEAPSVSIDAQDKKQTITLLSEGSDQNGPSMGHQNATFRCTATAGRPRPRLRWLRTGTGSVKTNLEIDNLDLYDLTKVSSATSNVKTIAEDNGHTLTLVISTISLDDEGDYVCLGENEAGRQSAVAQLIVQRPASIRIVQSSPYVAQLNESFHLDCLVSGHPVPTDIEWSRTDRGSFFSLISRSMHSSSQERAILKFDRVTSEELGEYTCNARDPLNPDNILRDTIMVVVGDTSTIEHQNTSSVMRQNESTNFMPKLMVRPTKINAPVGSNVTLDCLAVSGIQPTLVEWLASVNHQQSQAQPSIRPYYRGGEILNSGQMLQFGSKLKILNVSKAHEGMYQCKGRNRIGTEIAPALLKVIDPLQAAWDPLGGKSTSLHPNSITSSLDRTTRTKVAKYGSNIELKCQVNGFEQPATSWSRDGLELPKSSVQIGHNLWIQNVSNKDSGLYICSARSIEPNRIFQARINLLVEGATVDLTKRFKNLEAKIVASKSLINRGDSVTLECIIIRANGTAGPTSNADISSEDLNEIEKNIVWTNLHSGQSLFQDNVYILGNLLIIYELNYENSATYRCNYNELTQHTDYKLQVSPDFSRQTPEEGHISSTSVISTFNGESFLNDHLGTNQILVAQGLRVELKRVSLGSSITLECNTHGDYFWTRGSQRIPNSAANQPLVIDSIKPRDADIYSCHHNHSTSQYLVNVLMPAARFTQSPVSFITLPTISGANQQLEIELKFLPENEHGLLLSNGQQQQLSALNKSPGIMPTDGDYLALGLVDGGYLEFRFELGDGMTTLRSLQRLSLNQWHRVMIERNRRGAVMWVDDQVAVSNSTTGKFFDLNLDSVLFVGGHQQFLYKPASGSLDQQQAYGYSRGFQGCISLLRISRQEINLMARNRSVAVGIFECHKSECSDNHCSNTLAQNQSPPGQASSNDLQKQLTGICQVDRGDFDQRWVPTNNQVSAQAGVRCICMPGYVGDKCGELSSYKNRPLTAPTESGTSRQQSDKHQLNRACDLLNPCSTLGTVQCQSLTSQSYLCHCKIGFTGTDCSKSVEYVSKNSIHFNQHSYLQLSLKKAHIVESYLRNQSSDISPNRKLFIGDIEFNATNYAKQISMGDHQNISFNLQTNSSYGLLFYTGQLRFGATQSPDSAVKSSQKLTRPASSFQFQQSSKSMIVNLMSRLSQGSVSDYLSIALIDGHVEVSFELGSGVAILRSIQRVNDNHSHSIQVSRSGKLAKLTIDQVNKYEASSPGKLSVLNSDQDDFYIGGLPLSTASILSTGNTTHGQPSVIYSTHFANFLGCISQFEINSLGPLNLISSDHLTEIRFAQNLTPCLSGRQQFNSSIASMTKSPKPYTSPPIATDEKEPDELRKKRR